MKTIRILLAAAVTAALPSCVGIPPGAGYAGPPPAMLAPLFGNLAPLFAGGFMPPPDYGYGGRQSYPDYRSSPPQRPRPRQTTGRPGSESGSGYQSGNASPAAQESPAQAAPSAGVISY